MKFLPRNNTINFHYFANDRYIGNVHERKEEGKYNI